jgi:transcriptional regulator with XRE-family HTH domain
MVDAKSMIGGRLRAARENAGLSQAQVAKMLNLHRPAISEVEAGNRRVSADELARLAEIYDVSVDWLARGSDEGADPDRDRVELAARELLKLRREDLDRVLGLLETLRSKPRKRTRG